MFHQIMALNVNDRKERCDELEERNDSEDNRKTYVGYEIPRSVSLDDIKDGSKKWIVWKRPKKNCSLFKSLKNSVHVASPFLFIASCTVKDKHLKPNKAQKFVAYDSKGSTLEMSIKIIYSIPVPARYFYCILYLDAYHQIAVSIQH